MLLIFLAIFHGMLRVNIGMIRWGTIDSIAVLCTYKPLKQCTPMQSTGILISSTIGMFVS